MKKFYASFKDYLLSTTPRVVARPVTEHRSTEILAWRAWHLGEDLRLRSLAHNVRWDGPTLTADRKPALDHDHGIYAKKEHADLSQEGVFFTYANSDVVGEVALSGLVLEGDTGYRAEQCTIRRLVLQRVPVDTIPLEVQAALEERYQCEVELALLPDVTPPEDEADFTVHWAPALDQPLLFMANFAAYPTIVKLPEKGPTTEIEHFSESFWQRKGDA